MSESKRIEVNYNELIKHLYRNCTHYFYNFQEGECCNRKVTAETCSLHAFSEALSCPHDCPRLNTKEYGCDKGRCPRIKGIIKQLKS